MIDGCCYTCTKYEVLVLWCKLLPLLPNGVIFFHRVSHVFWLEAAGDACAGSARAPDRWYIQKIRDWNNFVRYEPVRLFTVHTTFIG